MMTTNFKELDQLTTGTKKKYHDSFKAHDNEAYKNERARYIRRSVSSRYNADNSVTVTVKDGYGNVTGEETFTKDDLFLLAQEKGESIIDKKARDKTRAERNKNIDDALEDTCKVIGMTVISVAVGKILDVAGKKSVKIVKNLARKIAK